MNSPIDLSEVKFRGKRIYDNEGWISGCLHHYYDANKGERRFCILDGRDQHFVSPESIGMYIGKKDKKGNKIYTNSLLKIRGFRGSLSGRATHKRHNKFHGSVYLKATIDRYLDLHYDKKQIKGLEAPIGDEKFDQHISYDSNLNRTYNSEVNHKSFNDFEIDIEVIGNTIDDLDKSLSDLGFDGKITWNNTYYGR